MSQNGKGDVQRPLSVDQTTFSNNWERTFSNAEYEPSRAEKYKLYAEYTELLHSGKFWELHPDLTGIWEVDKDTWYRKVHS